MCLKVANVVIVLVASLGTTLMIGAPSVYANQQVDTNGKPIIFHDSQGRPCTLGPAHDKCLYEFLEKIPGTPNYIDFHSGYKVGYPDGLKKGVYHHSKAEDNRTASWTDGYTYGWGKALQFTLEEPKTIVVIRRMLVLPSH